MELWTTAAPAISAAFLASFVEIVEAFTIVLAVALVRGWRPAVTGTAAALATLALIVLLTGPLLSRVPVHWLQVAIGILTLLFGLRWLRKAILRAGGVLALHDEEAELRSVSGPSRSSAEWLAGLTAYKAVLLEGIEVVFIVIAVGAGHDLLIPASIGALAAALLVLALGAALHRPLSRVPENTLKFGVGVMLTGFGLFWTGEGLGLEWPGGDAAILPFAGLVLIVALALVRLTRRLAGVPI